MRLTFYLHKFYNASGIRLTYPYPYIHKSRKTLALKTEFGGFGLAKSTAMCSTELLFFTSDILDEKYFMFEIPGRFMLKTNTLFKLLRCCLRLVIVLQIIILYILLSHIFESRTLKSNNDYICDTSIVTYKIVQLPIVH